MKKTKITVILIITILLTGCWDKIEIEEVGYVTVIGLDKGENNKVKVTFQIINPQISSVSGLQSNENSNEIITLLSDDIISAKDLANISFARRLTFSHTKVLIISEELAKTDRAYHLIESAQRDRDMRREIDLIVCKEEASEFINTNIPPFDAQIGKYYELMTATWEDTGFIPLANIHGFLQRTLDAHSLYLIGYATTMKSAQKELSVGIEDYIAGQVYKEELNPTQLIGSAVIKNGKMVGKLTGKETRLAMFLRPVKKTDNILTTFPDPLKKGEFISAKLMRGRIKIDISISEDYPIIDVIVPIKISISAIPSLVDYVEDQENQELLKKSIEKYYEDEAKKLIEKTQKEFGGEPFLWSSIARRKFLLFEDFEKYNWMEKYTKAKVNVDFDVKLIDFGKHSKPSKIGD